MSIIKALRFPISVRVEHGRLTRVEAFGKPDLEVATPPEFPGGIDGVWSPEDLLVTAVASCFAVTVVAIAERRELPIYDLRVSGTGHVSKRDDGRFGFVAIELDAEIETLPECIAAVDAVARRAERGCLIAQALDVPVHVGVAIRTAQAVPV
jgi:organic hydroperoxide reductase OsmC/OhrA